MKKMIIALAMVFTLTPGAFAGDEKVKPAVIEAFKNQFATAQEVTWQAGINYYRAMFNYNGNWMFAYYNAKAELLGLTRNISLTQLPYYLQSSLKYRYPDYWITDLFELSNEDGFGYYITLRNANTKITLESKDGGNWIAYQ